MTDEPGFAIEVVIAGQVVSVETSAEIARRNVTDAMGRHRSHCSAESLAPLTIAGNCTRRSPCWPQMSCSRAQ